MYSFGLVVFFVFSKGEHLCGDHPENLTNIKRGDLVNLHKIKDVPTAESLVLWTTAKNPKERPEIAEVLRHPLFWDKLKTLDFLKAVSAAFEDRSDKFLTDLKEIIDKDAHGIICSSPATCTKTPSEPNPTACADWTKKSLSPEVFRDIGSRSYNPGSFCDLIKIIRNTDSQWSQLSDEVRSEYGGTREAFHDYWMSRFPSLAVYLWDKLELTYLTAVLDPSNVSSEETYRTLLGISHLTEREKKKKFFEAASEGDISFVRAWIQLGLSLDEKDPDDYKTTALHKAAKSGHTPIVEDLLKAGATPNDKDKYGDTPLHEAARNGHKEAVDRLIQAGANPNDKDKDGYTPLYVAAGYGHKEAIDRLIQAGANPNEKENSGWTPLHLAANSGQKEAVDRLIQAGANPNEKNKYGDTPLHRAAFIGYKEVVKALLGGGASTTVQDNDGKTPRHVAVERNKQEIAQILAAHKV